MLFRRGSTKKWLSCNVLLPPLVVVVLVVVVVVLLLLLLLLQQATRAKHPSMQQGAALLDTLSWSCTPSRPEGSI
jgi:hypothetical protein